MNPFLLFLGLIIMHFMILFGLLNFGADPLQVRNATVVKTVEHNYEEDEVPDNGEWPKVIPINRTVTVGYVRPLVAYYFLFGLVGLVFGLVLELWGR